LSHIGQGDREQDAVPYAPKEISEEHPRPVDADGAPAGLALEARERQQPKLPVTSSSPSSTMMMRLTGNMIAPTSGCPVVTAPLNARLVAAPSSAPESAPRMRRSRGASASFFKLTSIIESTTSAGFA